MSVGFNVPVDALHNVISGTTATEQPRLQLQYMPTTSVSPILYQTVPLQAAKLAVATSAPPSDAAACKSAADRTLTNDHRRPSTFRQRPTTSRVRQRSSAIGNSLPGITQSSRIIRDGRSVGRLPRQLLGLPLKQPPHPVRPPGVTFIYRPNILRAKSFD